MLIRTLQSRLLLVAAVFALPFTVGGCGRTACFTWSSVEGACPAQADALVFFSNPKCPGKVTSVDSDGTLSHESKLCCYAVTEREQSDEAQCAGFGGANPSGGTSEGFGGSSSFAVASSATGAGGGTACASCTAELAASAPEEPICSGSADLFKALFGCMCDGACSAACIDDACQGAPLSSACTACVVDPAGCQVEFNACSNDP